MSFAEIVAAKQRLALLRCLEEAAGYSVNDSILHDMVAEVCPPALSRDRLRTELAWLAEQGLVTTANPAGSVLVATLTARGLDVAQGAASCPGVARPRPRE